MFAPPRRIKPRDQIGHRRQVIVIDPLDTAKRQVEPMWNEREMSGEQIELRLFLAGSVEIVIGRDLQKINTVAVEKQIGAKGLAEPDADAERGQVAFHGPNLRNPHNLRHNHLHHHSLRHRRNRLHLHNHRPRMCPGRISCLARTCACRRVP